MKKMRRKKAQVQLGENVVVLVIFFFLLVIAVLFYANIQKSKIKAQQMEFQKIQTIDLKTIISTLPELLCTENEDVTENCIDIINLNSLASYWNSVKGRPQSQIRGYYRYRFGTTDISVKMLDPLTRNWTERWQIYSEPIKNWTSNSTVYMPVSLYNATSNDYSFGVIELVVFSR